MRVRIEKPAGSKEFGVKALTGNVNKVVETLKELEQVVPTLAIAMKDLDVEIVVEDSQEPMEDVL